jgi:hypothetical protein
MGSSKSVNLTNDELDTYRLGAVKFADYYYHDKSSEKERTRIMYCQPDKALFLIKSEGSYSKSDSNFEKCKYLLCLLDFTPSKA